LINLALIRKKRLEQNLTQSDMSKLLGFNDRSIYTRIENGSRSLKAIELEKISEILGINLSVLFVDDCDDKTNNVDKNSMSLSS